MIDSSLLIHKIVPLFPTTVVDERTGHTKTTYVAGVPWSARVTWQRGQKALIANAAYDQDQIAVMMRYRKEFNMNCRIKFEGSVYEITTPPHGDYQSERLDFVATRLDDAAQK